MGPTTSPAFGVALRAIALLLLLAGALLPAPDTGGVDHWIVLVDRSRSVEARLAGCWPAVRDAFAEQDADLKVSVINFAEQIDVAWRGQPVARLSQQDLAPRNRDLNASATNLDRALGAALNLPAAGEAAGVILCSDGFQTLPAADEQIVSAFLRDAFPLLWLQPEPKAGPWIGDVRAPGRVEPGETVALRVTVEGVRPDAALTARLLLNDDPQPPVTLSEAGEASIWRTSFRAPESGVVRVGLELADDGGLVQREATVALVEVNGAKPIVSVGDAPNAFAESLAAGGYRVRNVAPAAAADILSREVGIAAVVIANQSAAALAVMTPALDRAVASFGTGLIVIGGPKAFGGGGYRGDPIETLLPVTAQPPRNDPPVAVQFLVDGSGSMARGQPSKLSLALAGARGAASGLKPGDWSGLMTYSTEPTTRVSLSTSADWSVLDQGLAGAGGGTRLAPALAAALQSLAASSPEQKLLVLISDGELAPADLDAARGSLAESSAELAVLAVGDDANQRTLAALVAGRANSEVRPLGQLSLIPQAIQASVGTRTAPWREDSIAIEPLSSGAARFAWPSIDGLAVTSARETAAVLLAADSGEPVAASWRYGAGRVLALSAGVGPWTPAWLNWQQWPQALAWLFGQAVSDSYESTLAFDVRISGGQINAQWDVGDANQAQQVSWRGNGPDGTNLEMQAISVGPGIAGARATALAPGLYSVSASAGSLEQRRLIWHRGSEPARGIRHPVLDAARPLSASQMDRQSAAGPKTPWRGLAVLLAIALLLLAWARERQL